jgi:hypothetical protein
VTKVMILSILCLLRRIRVYRERESWEIASLSSLFFLKLGSGLSTITVAK